MNDIKRYSIYQSGHCWQMTACLRSQALIDYLYSDRLPVW